MSRWGAVAQSRAWIFAMRFLGMQRRRFVAALAVVAAWYIGWTWRPDALAVVAFVLALLVLLFLPRSRSSVAYAYDLPGIDDGPQPPPKVSPLPLRRTIVALSLLLDLVALVLLPGWVLLIVAATMMPTWAVAYLQERELRLAERRLAEALRVYAPKSALAYAGYGGGSEHLMMWEPYLRAGDDSLVIFNFNENFRHKIRSRSTLVSPFIQLGPDPRGDLARLLVPSLQALYYTQNSVKNEHYMANRRITHVWLGHGDSDKAASYFERQARYDHLLVSGQAAIDRYVNHGVKVPDHKFVIIGRPQTDGIQSAHDAIASVESPVVLYAPTWQGADPSVDYSSLDSGKAIVEALIARGATVIFRPHPLTLRWNRRRKVAESIYAALQADTSRPHVWGDRANKDWSVNDCMNASDALISDVSSVVSDYLQSGKPYAMVSMRASVEEFRREFPVAEAGYVLLGDLSNVGDVLDDLLVGDPLSQHRTTQRQYVLGPLRGAESATNFASLVSRLASGGDLRG